MATCVELLGWPEPGEKEQRLGREDEGEQKLGGGGREGEGRWQSWHRSHIWHLRWKNQPSGGRRGRAELREVPRA